MFLCKSKSGIYCLYYAGLNGKQQKVSTGFSQKRDATGFLQSFRAEKRSNVPKVLFAGFVDDFLSYAQSSFAEQTIPIYKSCLTRFLRYVGNIPLYSPKAKHLDDYKGVRLKRVRPVSVNIEVRQIKAAFQTAVRWKHSHILQGEAEIIDLDYHLGNDKKYTGLAVLKWLQNEIVF